MRRLIGGMMFAFLLNASGAQAADLGSTKESDLAPPTPFPPFFNWGGFYLGLNGGYGTGSTQDNVVVGGVPFSSEVASSGGLIGGQIGWNYLFVPGVLVGVEGEADWTNIHSGGFQFHDGHADDDFHSRVRWIADISGRLGFTLDRTLFYGKGGVAWASVRDEATIAGAGYSHDRSSNTGWVLGGGIEAFITPTWSLKVEYNHFDFGGGSHWTTPAPCNVTIDTNQTVDLVKVGLNYKFAPREVVQPLK